MSYHNNNLTVDKMISILQAHSRAGRGNYLVKVEEYTVDDGDPVHADDWQQVNDEYKQVYFSGTP